MKVFRALTAFALMAASGFAQVAAVEQQPNAAASAENGGTNKVTAGPKKPEPGTAAEFFARARQHEQHGEYVLALADLDRVLQMDPTAAQAWQYRGIVHFKLAQIEKSIADFDEYLKLAPAQAPYHWQRGISYYYAGRFADGRRQFELHQTVNPNDVENAVWHFLCVANASSLEQARASLMAIRDDARVPMMQIHELFAGKISSDEVLKAARAGVPAEPELKQRLFYAHLYLGLYAEALKKENEAREHLLKAVNDYAGHDYMSDVARVHVILRKWKAQ